MSWLVVAKKDFRDAGRSRLLWAVTALFVLLVGGLAFAFATILNPGGDAGSVGFILFLRTVASFFISITALLLAYKAIAGERESGTISFLLGLPVTRRSVVVGKLVGRTGVLTASLFAGFVVAAVILLALGGAFDAGQFVLFTLLSAFYGAAFVSAAVALSAVTASATRAAAAAFGFWVFDQFWSALVLVLVVIANGFTLPTGPLPDWYHALAGLGPSAAYSNASLYFLPADLTAQLRGQVGGLPEWYGLVTLAVWLLAPLALGVWRFQQVDL